MAWAVYLFGRQMMLLVEPTRTGRWKWHGILICTEHAHQPAIIEEFAQLAPHDILKKWLYIDSRHEDFEPTMERVAIAIARDDQRFGIHPRPRKDSKPPSEEVSGAGASATRCTARSAHTLCAALQLAKTILTACEAGEAPQNAFVRVLKVILRR